MSEAPGIKNKVIGKVTEGSKKVVETVSNNPRTALYLVGGLASILILYKIGKAINNFGNGDTDIDDQVEGTGGNTQGATISDQTATNYAQQLLDAFNSKEPLYGTDEKTVADIFKELNNAQDFLKVHKKFGLKDYNGHNSPPTGPWSYVDSYEKRNLVYWLKSEIGVNDPYNLYNLVKNRVESAGFTF